ncbi:MAG: hypothetical protein P9L90_03515 [Candidatus Aadella gelida]|nr:hypothetical protein [Candidatus Aadella gelida]
MLFGMFGKNAKEEKKVLAGEVIHYFRKVNAAVIKVHKGKISVGDSILIERHSDRYKQKVRSMQVDHIVVDNASKGMEVAIKVKKKTRPGSKIYIVK